MEVALGRSSQGGDLTARRRDPVEPRRRIAEDDLARSPARAAHGAGADLRQPDRAAALEVDPLEPAVGAVEIADRPPIGRPEGAVPALGSGEGAQVPGLEVPDPDSRRGIFDGLRPHRQQLAVGRERRPEDLHAVRIRQRGERARRRGCGRRAAPDDGDRSERSHRCRRGQPERELPGRPRALDRLDRRRGNRLVDDLAGEDIFEHQARVADRLQPLARLLAQAAPHQLADRARRLRRQPREVRLLPEHPGEHVRDGLALEQPPPREHLVEHDPERPDVGPPVGHAARRLLRRHVGRGAEDHPLHGRAHRQRRRLRELRLRARRRSGRIHRLGEPEVEDFDFPFDGSLDVLRLQVSVDDALFVRLFERLGDLQSDGEAFIEG